MNDIEKLQKYRCKPAGEVGLCLVATVRESVAEPQPFFFDQLAKALDCTVVRIEQDLGHAYDLEKIGRL